MIISSNISDLKRVARVSDGALNVIIVDPRSEFWKQIKRELVSIPGRVIATVIGGYILFHFVLGR